jgi:L-lactate dehydrogenase complex protein LldE
MDVLLYVPCFMDQLYPKVAQDTMAVLEKVGCTVHYEMQQTCCGQPAFNAGFWEESKVVCQKLLLETEKYEYVVIPSASCAGFIKNYYGKLFDNSSLHNQVKQLGEKVYELTEFLIKVCGVKNWQSSFKGSITYHDSCAALRECKIKEEPRQLLAMMNGVELLEMDDTSICCGFGGTFAVKFEPISVGMGEQKVLQAIATKADYLVSTDMSCLMHLEGYITKNNKPIKTLHIAEILAQ